MGNDLDWNDNPEGMQENPPENNIEEPEEISENEIPEESSSTVEQESVREETPQPAEQGTYHWVNPEYQKRQPGTADPGQNTYETENYRERTGADVTGNAGMPGDEWRRSQRTSEQRNGYQGGAYHSNWQNQSDQPKNFSGPETGRRRYGSYQFASETQESEPKTRKKERRNRWEQVKNSWRLQVWRSYSA